MSWRGDSSPEALLGNSDLTLEFLEGAPQVKMSAFAQVTVKLRFITLR